MRRRHRIELKFKFWKPAGQNYTCTRSDLEAEIAAGGLSTDQIRRKMGQGYHLLEGALSGKELTQFDASFIEGGIKDWPAPERAVSLYKPGDDLSHIRLQEPAPSFNFTPMPDPEPPAKKKKFDPPIDWS